MMETAATVEAEAQRKFGISAKELLDYESAYIHDFLGIKCSECGVRYGSHSGLKCPEWKESRKMKDEQSETKIEGGTKHDEEKIRLELVPSSLLFAVGEILTFGATKYGARNWEDGFAWSRAYGALQRHLWSWWEGEDVDPETGKSHLWHAGCELAFLIEFEDTHPELDDRPTEIINPYINL
jgi:hypothetical protein